MLSVLSLAALVTASAMNRTLPQRALDQAAEQLVTDLKRARLEAQSTGSPITIAFNQTDYRSEPAIIDRTLANAVLIAQLESENQIVFSRSFANLGGRLVLKKNDRRAVIFIHPITGKIERVQ